jgi:hypothetical protein
VIIVLVVTVAILAVGLIAYGGIYLNSDSHRIEEACGPNPPETAWVMEDGSCCPDLCAA